MVSDLLIFSAYLLQAGIYILVCTINISFTQILIFKANIRYIFIIFVVIHFS